VTDNEKKKDAVFVPVQDDSAMVVIQASWAQRSAWVARNAPSFFSPPEELLTPLSVLLAATVFYPIDERSEGRLIQASMIPLLDILRFLERDPASVYGIDPTDRVLEVADHVVRGRSADRHA